jgi:xylulokinase
MEGITMQNYDLIHTMVNSGIKINTARIMGGPTKSALWNQMQADIYNIPVETLKVTEAGVLGAAVMAGKGSGIFTSIAEGAEQMVQIDREYTPNPENAKTYGDLYEVFCRLYEGLDEKGVFTGISAVQEKF